MNNKKLKFLIKNSLGVAYNKKFKDDLKSRFQPEESHGSRFGIVLAPVALLAMVVLVVSFWNSSTGSVFEKAYAEFVRLKTEVQERLAKGEVLYEKRLIESSGRVSYIEETWYDVDGNLLNIPRDYETNEILYGEFGGPTVIKQVNGKSVIYSPEKYSEEVTIPSPMYTCIELDGDLVANIDFPENDFTEFTFGAYSEDPSQVDLDKESGLKMLNSLSDSFTENGMEIFENIKNKEVFDYEEVEEEGVLYFVFTDESDKTGWKENAKFYVNSETYHLDKVYYEAFDENGSLINTQTTKFLDSSFISKDQFEKISDPKKYNLYLQPDLSADISYNHTDEGCYFPDGTKMTDEQKEEFWNTQVPDAAKTEFKAFIDEAKSF